jgi:hypothetical protein
MISHAIATHQFILPRIDGEFSMIPFDLTTLKGLSTPFQAIARQMLTGLTHAGGNAFFTVHGKTLKKGQTLRRGAPHTDGSYDKDVFSWKGGGGMTGKSVKMALISPVQSTSVYTRVSAAGSC